MDMTHVSGETMVLFEDESYVTFKRHAYNGEEKPAVDETRKAVKGVQLEYAFCGEQDFGIKPMLDAFGAGTKEGIITKVPKGFELDVQDDVAILKYGYWQVDTRMISAAKETGVVGAWEDNALMICASKEYQHIIEGLIDMIQPKKAKFGMRRVFAGCNLLILAI